MIRAKGGRLRVDGGTSTNEEEAANILGEYYESLYAKDSYSIAFLSSPQGQSSVDDYVAPPDNAGASINDPFSWAQLAYALKQCSGSSAGHDKVGYPLIKKLPISGHTRILDLINQAWT